MARALPLGFATLDLDRQERQGLPEVVYGPGELPKEINAASWPCSSAARARVLVTRVDLVIAAAVDFPGAEHDERARLLTWRTAAAGDFTVAVVTAGTSDGPAADETAAIARAIGLRVHEIRDARVAGDPRVAGSRAGYRQPGGGGDGDADRRALLRAGCASTGRRRP